MRGVSKHLNILDLSLWLKDEAAESNCNIMMSVTL